MNFLRQTFRKLSSNGQTVSHTDRHDRNYILRRFADGQIWHDYRKAHRHYVV